jgi:outer membrane protein assembly factor BamB
MKRSAGLAALAIMTVAGLAPATALSLGRALAGTATVASPARLWVTHQYVKRGGFNLKGAASPDGSAVFVASEVEKLSHRGTNATVTALNPTTGATLWQTQYTASPNSGFSHVAVSPDGARVYVTGESPAASGALQFATVAYGAATGAVAWVARYGHPTQNSAGVGVAVSPASSKVYVTGDTSPYGTTIGYGA